jgi:phage terminase large subunit GpA-like protein
MTMLVFLMAALIQTEPFIEATQRAIAGAVSPPIRTIGQFAEDEIRLVSGVHIGKRYRIHRKPSVRLWFSVLDDAVRQHGIERDFLRFTYLGPNQFGKSLEAFSIPILYFLFEAQEDVICGVPTGDIADAKWNEDIRPFILASRFKSLLPTGRGKGSKGGTIKAGDAIRFEHGRTLTFMSFGGRDKSRAAKTTRVLIITEADGAVASEVTLEEDPIGQLERRALNFDLDAIILKESTVSTTKGPVWHDWKAAGEPRVARPCPHCGEPGTPEKEHFTGWKEGKTVKQAGRLAAFHCPSCEKPWTDEQRIKANEQSTILYPGQELDESGIVHGDPPDTDQFAIRFTDADNPFRTSDFLGRACWRAERKADKETEWRGLDQKHFAIPWRPDAEAEIELVFDELVDGRNMPTQLGALPEGHEIVTAGVDLRASQVHYVVVAWRQDGTGRVVAYGVIKVKKSAMGYSPSAIWTALKQLRDGVFPAIAANWGDVWYRQVWMDSAWSPLQGANLVDQFISQSWQLPQWAGVLMPILGRGVGQYAKGEYSRPRTFGKTTWYVGPDSHGAYEPSLMCKQRYVINVDEAKTWGQSRLAVAIQDEEGNLTPGAVSFFTPTTGDHSEFVRHLLSEHGIREYKPGIGEVTKFYSDSRVNHWLDCYGYACSAARSKYCNVEVRPEPPAKRVVAQGGAVNERSEQQSYISEIPVY